MPPKTNESAGFFRSAKRSRRRRSIRPGAASLDLMLVLGVVLPLLAFVFWAAPRIMYLVYQMIAMLVSWPFM